MAGTEAKAAMVNDFEACMVAFRSKPDCLPTRSKAIYAFSSLLNAGQARLFSHNADSFMREFFDGGEAGAVENTASSPSLLSDAIAAAAVARQSPLPEEFGVSPWWRNKQTYTFDFLSMLSDPRSVVWFAQCTWLSGCDRRIFDNPAVASQVVEEQVQAIRSRYGYDPLAETSPDDPVYSIESSIITTGGGRGFRTVS